MNRTACRALFLLLCVAPTLAVAGWTASRLAPGVADRRLAELGRRVGLRVDCSEVATPSPGILRLTGLEFRDLELGDVLAECDGLEARLDADAAIVEAGRLRIEADRLPRLAAALHQLLKGDSASAFELRFEQLHLIGSGREQTWRGVRVALAERERGFAPELTVEAAASEPSGEGLRLTAIRNRQIEPPATRVRLATGGAPIATEQLAGLLPAAASLPSGADFVGMIEATLGEAPSGRLSGELRGMNLASLIAMPAESLRLDSPAAVAIDRLAWSGDRIAELRATVTAGAGSASRPLVYDAYQAFSLQPGQQLNADWQASPDAPIAFDRLALAVEIDDAGLRVRGGYDPSGGAPPCLVSRAGEALLYPPAVDRLPINALLQFVAGPEAPLRPTGAAVEAFARRLPEARDAGEPAFRTHSGR